MCCPLPTTACARDSRSLFSDFRRIGQSKLPICPNRMWFSSAVRSGGLSGRLQAGISGARAISRRTRSLLGGRAYNDLYAVSSYLLTPLTTELGLTLFFEGGRYFQTPRLRGRHQCLVSELRRHEEQHTEESKALLGPRGKLEGADRN